MCTLRHARWSLAAAAVVTLAGASTLLSAQDADPREIIAVELALLVDTSGSVDEVEYQLQQQGYVDAFMHPDFGRRVESLGGIVVTYVEWSDTDHQAVRLDWTKLESGSDCRLFAQQINALPRSNVGFTRLAPALEHTIARIESNDYMGLRRVIDVSGDGRCQNYDFYAAGNDEDPAYGTPWNTVIASLAGRVDQVNGICITQSAGVANFYRDVLPQGRGGFMMQVESFEAFGDAILEKLMREIRKPVGTYD